MLELHLNSNKLNLDKNFTKDQLFGFLSVKLNNDFKIQFPVSFIFFIETEIIDKKLIINHSVFDIKILCV